MDEWTAAMALRYVCMHPGPSPTLCLSYLSDVSAWSFRLRHGMAKQKGNDTP